MNLLSGKTKHVSITCAGITFEGPVKSAHNYGTEADPDWYIEFSDHNGFPHYWKQGIDGGKLNYLGYPLETAEVIALLDDVLCALNVEAQRHLLGLDKDLDDIRQEVCNVRAIMTGQIFVGNLQRSSETAKAMATGVWRIRRESDES